ncbi:hypothetical protein ACSBOB_01650 [Mesorhizobium sp. ASY16-5R]|uniref:hypothetical protein n=1 Tax=Mesorhizobium sp. ASY16-5R TaxID=3445772 RepID=UPI003F9FEF33
MDEDYWCRWRARRAYYRGIKPTERRKAMAYHRGGLCGIIAMVVMDVMLPELDGKRYVSISHWGLIPYEA